jgi:hypothetical protein
MEFAGPDDHFSRQNWALYEDLHIITQAFQ